MEANEADGMRIEAVVTAAELTIGRAAFDRVATLTQACATAPIASPRDRIPSAADPAWLPTADEGATAGMAPST